MPMRFTEIKHITAIVSESFTDDSCFINGMSMRFTEMKHITEIFNDSFIDDNIIESLRTFHVVFYAHRFKQNNGIV